MESQNGMTEIELFDFLVHIQMLKEVGKFAGNTSFFFINSSQEGNEVADVLVEEEILKQTLVFSNSYPFL